MAETLEAFIIRRRREIAVDARNLDAAMAKLEAELAQLSAAAKAAGLAHVIEQDLPDTDQSRAKVASEKTIKEAVIAFLLDANRGFSALDILAAINTRFGFDYPRTSLSPQLSRLKADGWLEREGLMWKATEEAKLLGEYEAGVLLSKQASSPPAAGGELVLRRL